MTLLKSAGSLLGVLLRLMKIIPRNIVTGDTEALLLRVNINIKGEPAATTPIEARIDAQTPECCAVGIRTRLPQFHRMFLV